MNQFFEKAQNLLTEQMLKYCLSGILLVLGTIAIFLHDDILSIVLKKKAESLLVWVVMYSAIAILLLLLALLYLIFYKHRLKIKLGARWDRKLDPYCPNCRTALTSYDNRERNREFSPSYECIKCNKIIFLNDGEKIGLGIDEARKILIERKLFKKIKTF